jgi:hypothetical protein
MSSVVRGPWVAMAARITSSRLVMLSAWRPAGPVIGKLRHAWPPAKDARRLSPNRTLLLVPEVVRVKALEIRPEHVRRFRAGVGALMPKVAQDADAPNENSASSSLPDETVCNGVRQMLAAALQADVITYFEGFADEVGEQGRRLVVRRGNHAEREVVTAGAVAVRQPRVNDKRIDSATGERHRFSSAILPA